MNSKGNYSQGHVDINGIIFPVEVLQKAQSIANDKNTEVGIWEADRLNSGYMGFIIIPLKYKNTDNKKTLIKGYVPPFGGANEKIPEPIHTVTQDEEYSGMDLYPERRIEQRQSAYVDRLSNPEWDFSVFADSKKIMMKKADWTAIGKKSGWLKDSDIAKDKLLLQENYKQAIPIAPLLMMAVPTILSAAPQIIEMFSGNKEEAEAHVEEALKNPQMMQQQNQEASAIQQRIGGLISNLQSYAEKIMLPCAKMAPPEKCSGTKINDISILKNKISGIEQKYNTLSKTKNGDVCAILKEAHDLNVCAQGVIQLNAVLSQEIGYLQSANFDFSGYGV